MDMHISIPPTGDVTRIVLLGLLAQRPMHGYAVHRTIEERRMDQWVDIKAASIYAALQRLEREGLVEPTGTTRAGRRPPATVYRTTPAGVEELRRLLRQAWTQIVCYAASVDVALSFHQLLADDDVIALLETRLAALHTLTTQADAVAKGFAARAQTEQLPNGVRAKVADIMDHQRRQIELERDWTEMVLRHARAGAYTIDSTELQRLREGIAVQLDDDERLAPLAAGIQDALSACGGGE